MPCGGPVNPKAVQSFMALIAYSGNHGIKIENIGVTERVLVTTARTTLAQQFLGCDSEWSFWIDDDMILPSETLVHLLEVAKENEAKIVSAHYYQRLPPYKPVCFRSVGNKYLDFAYVDPDKVAVVDGIGFGCVLIHKSVFEKIGADSFRFKFYEEQNRYMGEDIYFCEKASKAGFKIWVDGKFVVGHIGAPEIVFRRK